MGERAGASFEEADVVENYPFRPPYPEQLFEQLLAIAPQRKLLLDIGCGPGKVSRPLAAHFETVTAVDPSRQMIALGRSLPGGDARNIRWIEGFAEDFPIGDQTFDLTVAAASIHWMDHPRLCPRLAAHAARNHIFAVLSGDDPFEPAWHQDWHRFLGRWVPEITGHPFDHDRQSQERASYKQYLQVKAEEYFLSAPIEQSVSDFIRCQHSRDTFAPSRLGTRYAHFDAELADMLRPYAVDGRLSFKVRSRLA